jgi:hypothetical protein
LTRQSLGIKLDAMSYHSSEGNATIHWRNSSRTFPQKLPTSPTCLDANLRWNAPMELPGGITLSTWPLQDDKRYIERISTSDIISRKHLVPPSSLVELTS